jgi:hypothetical protein
MSIEKKHLLKSTWSHHSKAIETGWERGLARRATAFWRGGHAFESSFDVTHVRR